MLPPTQRLGDRELNDTPCRYGDEGRTWGIAMLTPAQLLGDQAEPTSVMDPLHQILPTCPLQLSLRRHEAPL